MAFIEFNGLPGSGKTTVVHKLIAALKAEGIETISLEDIVSFKGKPSENKWTQLIKAIFCPSCFTLNHVALRIAIDSGFSIERIRFAMRLIKLNYQVRRILNLSNANVLLLDEGFIQFVTSIPHDKKFVNESLVEKLCMYIIRAYSDYWIVNCILPIETTIARSKNRQSSISRFDGLDTEELKEILCTRLDNIKLMQKYMPNSIQYEISFLEDIDKNVEHLKRFVKERILN